MGKDNSSQQLHCAHLYILRLRQLPLYSMLIVFYNLKQTITVILKLLKFFVLFDIIGRDRTQCENCSTLHEDML